ncbi:MAG: type VI secretion system lipoprotein TssJ [Planctomycetaceae bacterium]|nr:type VI secretion system lipoprotein TssJ [Planctomycetaceae bacterium]
MRGLHGVLVSLVVVLSLVCSSCSNDEKREDLPNRTPAQIMTLNLAVSDRVNCIDGNPASLVICVYQLDMRRDFDGLVDDPASFQRLLEGEKFSDSVLGRERYFLNPGENKRILIERRPGTRLLGLAAGYYNSSPQDASLVIVLPSAERRMLRPAPSPVVLDIEVGRDSLSQKQR